jgi:hypothetical protein
MTNEHGKLFTILTKRDTSTNGMMPSYESAGKNFRQPSVMPSIDGETELIVITTLLIVGRMFLSQNMLKLHLTWRRLSNPPNQSSPVNVSEFSCRVLHSPARGSTYPPEGVTLRLVSELLRANKSPRPIDQFF